MKTLILSGRYTLEFFALWQAAQPTEWRVESVRKWRVSPIESEKLHPQ
jgi:hypothetical protein